MPTDGAAKPTYGAAEPTAGSDRSRLRTATGLGVVGLVALAAAVAQSFGRFTFGVILPAVRDDLGLSNTVAGTLATANVGAYLAGTLFVAAVTSTVRLLAVLRFGLVLSASGMVIAALAPGAGTLGVALFLMGFGGACIWIPSPVIAADALAPERRALAVGLLGSGMGLGIVFSGQLSGFLRSRLGDDAWRNVYAVQAAIAVVAVVLVLLLVRHRQGKPSSKSGIGGFSALRRMRGWLPLTVLYAVFGLMYLLFLAFLTTRLEDDNGWSEGRASLAFTVLGFAMIFGGPTFVLLASRIGSRLALGGAFAGWAVFSVAVLPGWFVPSLLASVGAGLLFGAIPSMTTLYVVQNTETDDYGPSFAAATLAFGVAQMASPQLGGLIADLTGSFTWVFLLSTALAVVGLVAALQLPRHSE